MLIQYMSDLHIEFEPFFVEKKGDVLILAGDVFSRNSQIQFREFMKHTLDLGFDAVFFVMGNHEGYGWSYEKAKDILRTWDTDDPTFWFLDRSGIVFNGQRFMGATLWSHPSQSVMCHARLYTNDYRAVKDWTTDDHVREHHKDLEYLIYSAQEGDVIITHNPPRMTTGIDWPRFGGDTLNSWFANNMELAMKKMKPALWVSGHTHKCWEDEFDGIHDVGNCRGYVRRNRMTGKLLREVPDFDPHKTIIIGEHDEAVNASSGRAA